MLRLMVADVDSPSYFVATAAVELGFFKDQGIDIELELVYGARSGPERLREGTLHFFGGPAYAATRAFPGWKGTRLLCALAQYSYWFMAVRADLDVKRGDMNAIKGLRISSSTAFPNMALKHMLAEAGLNLERDKVEIVPSPTTDKNELWRGHDGIEAIARGADAYWGNGMRAAIGEKLGVAKIHLDLRRGDGPPGARLYNFAALTATEQFISERPQIAAAAVRAIVKTQRALKADPGLATKVGRRIFPQEEASLIGDLVARDTPFYDASISVQAVDGLNKFACANGLISQPVPYDQLVAPPFIRQVWNDE